LTPVAAHPGGGGDGGDFDVEVDAVEQGAGDFAEVLGDLGAGTAAFARGVAVEAAFATVHVTTELA
jgi:hypothetical protein